VAGGISWKDGICTVFGIAGVLTMERHGRHQRATCRIPQRHAQGAGSLVDRSARRMAKTAGAEPKGVMGTNAAAAIGTMDRGLAMY
jgi:hypothetical protein